MRRYSFYTGDGNHGVRKGASYLSDTIEQAIDFARKAYAYEGEAYRREDLDADQVVLVLDEASDGSTAHNGAAFHVIEIVEESL